jgi:hypothetical protein
MKKAPASAERSCYPGWRGRLRLADDEASVTDMPPLLQEVSADALFELGVGPGAQPMLEPAADELAARRRSGGPGAEASAKISSAAILEVVAVSARTKGVS